MTGDGKMGPKQTNLLGAVAMCEILSRILLIGSDKGAPKRHIRKESKMFQLLYLVMKGWFKGNKLQKEVLGRCMSQVGDVRNRK